MILSNFFTRLIIVCCGMLYPIYGTFKAFRKKNKRNVIQWTMYWATFTLCSVAEILMDILVPFLPLYNEMKVALIIYLVPCGGNGGELLYRQYLHPFLKKYEHKIDKYLEYVLHRGIPGFYDIAIQTARTGYDFVRELLVDGINFLENIFEEFFTIRNQHLGVSDSDDFGDNSDDDAQNWLTAAGNMR